MIWDSQVVLMVKNLPANAGDIRDMGSVPGQEDPCRSPAPAARESAWRGEPCWWTMM